ncbi:25813_t:CDS:2 [Gigaspora rosea]|nr:25813_t:CDS:2 [Gigaspora rosea]
MVESYSSPDQALSLQLTGSVLKKNLYSFFLPCAVPFCVPAPDSN